MVEVKVDKALVKKVAQNARLELSEAELAKFTPQLKEVILDSFNLLDEIDADEEPSFQPIKQQNKLRKDEVKPSLSQDEALANVNVMLRDRGYIKGPKSL
ncbi:MAG: Asp-tRNA(Asn)/Glu-tRNA(Gln) amidotransferase subunit GatC [Candidatus Diapherotrites archaeon]|jgi:aspartyl-tRNA(Asn)/glutamyl-tRNA(Gln) amidotransferase subunit C|nr:Asp-tRNA(Asn)/Glu-tRNA(Gln) amidotransferase subunit GatC [Candidatus Diapherotrites archaeon]MBT4597349.1 Asp-tRNA(Asn)/Glu-tRNA(Gln) amidotransferase subunit GatC [Candidatus Diapherotrites archaeon]